MHREGPDVTKISMYAAQSSHLQHTCHSASDTTVDSDGADPFAAAWSIMWDWLINSNIYDACIQLQKLMPQCCMHLVPTGMHLDRHALYQMILQQ